MIVNRTSQLSRMAHNPAATDLSGGKTSEVLSTVRTNNLAAEDAVCFQSDLSLDVVPSVWTGSGAAGFPAQSVRGGDSNSLVHVLSDSPPWKMEGAGVVSFLMFDWGRGSARSTFFPRLDPLSACRCGYRPCLSVSFPPVPSSLPPWSCPIPTADRETDTESPGRESSFPTPALVSPPLDSPSTTTPGSDCEDKPER